MPADCTDHLAMNAASLPQVYADLLACARRMLQRAQSRCWASLLDEEVEFFRAYERVAKHESRCVTPASDHRERALCDRVHRDVARDVAEARRLLLVRQAELLPSIETQADGSQQTDKAGLEGYTLLL